MNTLRQIAKIILIIVGVFITLPVLLILFFDDTPEKWYAIIPFTLIGGLILLVGIKLKAKAEPKPEPKKVVTTTFEQTAPNQTTMTTTIDEKALTELYHKTQKEKQAQIKNYRYQKETVIGKIYQALESIEIIETTKNIDTLESRYNFLLQLFQELKLASYTPRYVNDVQVALDQYKQMYYDKTPTQIQLVGLLKPKDFDMVTFYCNSIYNCFIKHYETQMKEIAILKTESGKKGRYKKLYESVLKAKQLMYDDCLGAINFEDLYQNLEEKEYQLEDFL
jgi:hypothetical protein